MLFVLAFGATVNEKGTFPSSKQLVLSASQDQMVVRVASEPVRQPIIQRAEVVTPRCRDVRFDFSAQYCISTCATNRIELQFDNAVMNSRQKSAIDVQMAEVVTPRCRTVSFSSFVYATDKNVTDYSEAISPACRDVING